MDDSIDGDPVEIYEREVRLHCRPLSREEELERIGHVRARDAQAESALKDLVEACLPMVVDIARQYKEGKVHLLDLFVKGNDGLFLAAQTFHETASEDFAAHARPYVERAIAEALSTSKP